MIALHKRARCGCGLQCGRCPCLRLSQAQSLRPVDAPASCCATAKPLSATGTRLDASCLALHQRRTLFPRGCSHAGLAPPRQPADAALGQALQRGAVRVRQLLQLRQALEPKDDGPPGTDAPGRHGYHPLATALILVTIHIRHCIGTATDERALALGPDAGFATKQYGVLALQPVIRLVDIAQEP